MVQNPPEGFPQITPYLLYNDVDGAVDWLVASFGFTERYRMPGSDGKTVHAEVAYGPGVIMMGCPEATYKNPKQLGGATQITYVYVDNVDEHYNHAKASGVQILRELEDQFYGDRMYAAVDPEGHQWSFSQHTRDVPPEDMQP